MRHDPFRHALVLSGPTGSGKTRLGVRLAEVDPATAARLHPHDVRRVVRALEVWQLTGRPISAWQTQWTVVRRPSSVATGQGQPATHPVLWLNPPRAELYARIDARVRE